MKLIIKKSILGISLVAAAVYCQIIILDTENTTEITPTAIQDVQNSDTYC